ncbi:MAG: hypothetical protein GAK29_04358 [Acinetobacter bereziniae]|uniref:Uncharacterized protein n=1 Tax=Acinetobacter bereziniae TaxID=106648 RepID=A0A833PBT7_ACIBZ|nr:MAG: hypothetical protein GAK29_04358 [Acinetobacter bereziniae]
MAGRKPLKLTNSDYYDILEHIHDLPFKRKCEQKLLDICENNKGDLSFFTPEDFEVLKKCRYERNAYMKRQTLLQLILATDPRETYHPRAKSGYIEQSEANRRIFHNARYP